MHLQTEKTNFEYLNQLELTQSESNTLHNNKNDSYIINETNSLLLEGRQN